MSLNKKISLIYIVEHDMAVKTRLILFFRPFSKMLEQNFILKSFDIKICKLRLLANAKLFLQTSYMDVGVHFSKTPPWASMQASNFDLNLPQVSLM